MGLRGSQSGRCLRRDFAEGPISPTLKIFISVSSSLFRTEPREDSVCGENVSVVATVAWTVHLKVPKQWLWVGSIQGTEHRALWEPVKR